MIINVQNTLQVVIFAILYWILDSFETTKKKSHLEFAARIGGTGFMLYWKDDVNPEVLHWLYLIISGYYFWHSYRVIWIEKKYAHGWHHIFSLMMCYMCIKGHIPYGIMLIMTLMEIPNIFLNTVSLIETQYRQFEGTIIHKACNVLFFATWIYFRLWIVLPLLVQFSFFNDSWSAKTPLLFVYTTRICVTVYVFLHTYWTCILLEKIRRVFAPNMNDRQHIILTKLSSKSY